MSVWIEAEGTSRDADGAQVLSRIAEWLAAGPPGVRVWSVDAADEQLTARLHPAVEGLVIRAAAGQVVARASCSAGGPGYQRHVADVLQEIGSRFGVRWDEPGSLQQGREQVEAEHLQWIKTLAQVPLERTPDDAGQFRLAMSIDSDRFEHDAMGIGWLGRRDLAWFLDAAAGDRAAAVSFFPWWDDGWCATTLRNTALGIMWTEVRWRPPADSDDTPALREADRLLGEAHRLDPQLELPWTAWHELRSYLATLAATSDDAPDDLAERASRDTAAPIGYRRRPVTTSPLPGWWIRVPGEFTYGWECNRWWAWDGVRQIDLSGCRAGDIPSAELIRRTRPTVRGTRPIEGGPGPASVLPDDGTGRSAVQGVASVRDGELIIVTISGADLPWAIETWRSLRAERV